MFGKPDPGSVAFEGLTGEYYVNTCWVSEIPAVEWSTATDLETGDIKMEPQEYQTFLDALFGFGGPGTHLSYNKAAIRRARAGAGGIHSNSNDAAFDFSGNASVQAEFKNTDPDKPSMTLGFNNVVFSGGHAVINMTSSFSLPETSGLFTLVDAEEYAGKFVVALGATKSGKALWGIGGADSEAALKGVRIGNDGKAAVPIYLIDGMTPEEPFKDYPGNSADDPLLLFWFYILDEEDFDAAGFGDTGAYDALYYSGTSASAISVTNGKATISADAEGVIKP